MKKGRLADTMKAGAIEFLTKPFRDRDLVDAVQLAFQRDRDRRVRESAVSQTRAHFEGLTPGGTVTPRWS